MIYQGNWGWKQTSMIRAKLTSKSKTDKHEQTSMSKTANGRSINSKGTHLRCTFEAQRWLTS